MGLTSQKIHTKKGNLSLPSAALDKGNAEVGTAIIYGCMDGEEVFHAFPRVLLQTIPSFASFPNHSNVCGFSPIPLMAKLLSSYS